MLGVDYPILQGGMRWVANAQLVAAVANAGGFGFLSAHTFPDGDSLREEIDRIRRITDKPFGVNLTVLPANTGIDYAGLVTAIIDSGVIAVETAGSNPANYIAAFKEAGIKVLHKCTTVRHAIKAEQLGADVVCIDGFECAGHPGRDDVPGLVLIPLAVDAVQIPVVACGGFSDGRGLVAALALGAEGINMGTRFMLTSESPMHDNIKQRMLSASERDTLLLGRSYGDPSRVLKNSLALQAFEIESQAVLPAYQDLAPLTGAPRWIRAMKSGDFDDGVFPVGVVVGRVTDVPSCEALISGIIAEARQTLKIRLGSLV